MAYRKIEDSKLKAVANSIRMSIGADNTMSIDDMPVLVADIGMRIVPEYWRDYLKVKATEINTALQATANRSAFIWYTDTHWVDNYNKSPMILKYLSENTQLSKTFFGGDIAQANNGELEAISSWKNMVKNIPNHRSLIGNHDNNTKTELPTADERAEYFLMFNRTSDMITGADENYTNSDINYSGKMFYYIDDEVEKTRYICMSTGRMWVYADETSWVVNTLNSTPNGWHIVILGHLWLNNKYESTGTVIDTTPPDYTQFLLDVFDAYNSRLSGVTAKHNVSYNFVNAGGKIEFIIGGHVHVDYDFRTTGGIPIILTECDGSGERDPSSSATKGTTTENCVYGVVADYAADAIKVINVGRGDTRTISITMADEPDEPDTPEIPEGNYTNQLKIATDTDGSVYNGIGYKENTRYSSSSFAETTHTGWYLTGYIPVKTGDVVRLANMKFLDIDDEVTNDRACIYFFNDDYSFNVITDTYTPTNHMSDKWSAVYGENGDVVQFTIPVDYGSSVAKMRINAKYIDEYSVITVNDEFGNGSGGTDEPVTPDTPEIPEGDYVNQIPISIESDGTLYNGGNGYKENYRINSSGVETADYATGWDITGFIPVRIGDVIRFANCMFYDMDSSRGQYPRASFAMYDESFALISKSADYTPTSTPSASWSPVHDSNGDLIQVTMPTAYGSGVRYMRLTMADINDDSVITVNQVIGWQPTDEPDEPAVPDIPEGNYTNQLRISLDLDGDGIFGNDYNGDGTPDGYIRDMRTSSSGDTGATGWCVTGLIPAKQGDIIRFKNMEYYDISGDGGSTPRTTFFVYSSTFQKLINASHNPSNPPEEKFNAVFGDNGDIVQLTAPFGWGDYAYIRLCCGDLNEYSIITVNEEIGNSSGGADEPDTPEAPEVSNNVLPTAIGFDGNILNANTTTGYAENSRYSTSSNKLSTLTGTYSTGLIPCTPSSVIRMRNISTEQANNYDAVYIFNLNDTDGDGIYYNTKYTFTEMLGDARFKTVVDDSGNMIEFTLPGWQVNQTHMAICSQYIGSDSIITVDTPINN